MATKKVELEDGEEMVIDDVKTPRIAHDFQRTDLNELRDAVNELFARG